jgi:3-hydroxybutyryl-CoA dehydrogenase
MEFKMPQIKNIMVVGSGTMGHGVAQSFAMGGYEVAMQDSFPQALERADKLIRGSLDTMVEAGLIKTADIPKIIARIHPTLSLEEAAKDADLAIECIIENKDAKIDLFKKMDTICPSKTILASNSSMLNIFDFVETSRPDKLLVTHFYAPPQIIPLVDILKNDKTDIKNVNAVVDILKKLGKKPIVFNKPIAGYVVSRIMVAYQREIYYLLDNGYISAKDLDDAMIWGLGMRMLVVGGVQRIDFGGLDLSAKNATNTKDSTPLEYKPKLLYELVEKGNLGVKSGKGFYDYNGKSEAEMCHDRDVRLLKLLKVLQENDITGPVL